MSQAKVFNKGQTLFKEGDKLTHLYFIQSGSVQCLWPRGKKAMEFAIWGPGQVLGDFCLSQITAPYQAVANTEVKVVEIPVDAFLKQWESLSQPIKVFGKSISDRFKWAQSEIKNYKLDREASPCGEDQVAKAFASFFYSAKAKMKTDPKNAQICLLEWPLVRQYGQRMFSESPKRMEQILLLLSKHGFAKIQMGVPPENPEGPEEIREVTLSNMEVIEKFFEFYQYFYFKGGKQEPLKFDDTLYHLMTCFTELAEKFSAKDRSGVVNIPYNEVLKYVKETTGLQLNNDHFLRLDTKGIMAHRKSMTDGQVVLQFNPDEMQQFRVNWIFLKEIERWNEKGSIDIGESVLPKKPAPNTNGNNATTEPCPDCGVQVSLQAKFCQECGCKLNRAA